MLYGAIGAYLLAHPVAGLASLTLALTFYLVLEGVWSSCCHFSCGPPGQRLVAVRRHRDAHLAAMIGSAWPISSVWAVGTLIGVRHVLQRRDAFDGLSRRAPGGGVTALYNGHSVQARADVGGLSRHSERDRLRVSVHPAPVRGLIGLVSRAGYRVLPDPMRG
jgi:hypothetical protein